MAIPKENRQQMINMMYLVLTAMLALNVSAEILNAFKTVNKSLENSKVTADTNLKTTYNAFAAKKAKEPTNVAVTTNEEKTKQAQSISDALLASIDKLKKEVISRSGGADQEDANGIMLRKDDMEVSTGYLVEGTSGKNGEGYKLKQEIDETLKKLYALVEPADLQTVQERVSLNTTPNDKNGDWVREEFYQMPAIASYAMLTKLENDIKNTQGTMASYFFSKIGASQELTQDQIVFDKFSAQITAPSTYILRGETFEANVSLAATSSKNAGTVSVNVNGQNIPVDQATGIAKYKAAPGVGEYSLKGTVSVKNDRTGKVSSYPIPEMKYTVAAPFATVSPTKMNVFYIGVDNPVEISAAGASANDLKVSMTAGTISGSGGKYSVRVTQQGTTNVNVNAKGKAFPPFPFRVKMIPNPIAKVSGMPGGRINAAVWKAQKGVLADLENFDFDAKFEVLSFNMFYQPKLQDPGIASATGPYFSAAMQSFISKAKPGDLFYIEEIKVKGPDGMSRKIPGIAFKID
jgi:gliding motility-associated protein GldM